MQMEAWKLIVIMIVSFITFFVISVVRWRMEEEEKRIRNIMMLKERNRIRQEEAYHRALSEEITKQEKKDGAPEIVTQLNGETICGSISVSADSATITSDGIEIGHIPPLSGIDAGHIAPSSSIEDVLMEKVEKRLAAFGNIAVKESTNCPNCGASFSGTMFCRYCGTKKS